MPPFSRSASSRVHWVYVTDADTPLQHLGPSERYPPLHQRVLDQMRRALCQVCLFPAADQRGPYTTVRKSSIATHLSSRISPQSLRQYISTGTFLFGLVTAGQLGPACPSPSPRHSREVIRRLRNSATHPSTGRRRTRRPSSAASQAGSPVQSVGSGCAGARCIAWRVTAPRLTGAGAALGRGRYDASTSRSGVSAYVRLGQGGAAYARLAAYARCRHRRCPTTRSRAHLMQPRADV